MDDSRSATRLGTTWGVTRRGPAPGLLGCALALQAAGCNPVPAEPEGTVVIRDIAVVTPDGDGTRAHQTVIVRDGKIADLVDAADAPTPRRATVVDGTGKFLVPGLIDAHAHIHVRTDLERYLAQGVTSAREMWGRPRELRWRQAIRSGQIPGPNLVVSSTYFWAGGPETTKHFEPSDPATARALVRQAADEGYDLIKVVSIKDMDVLPAIIDEAGAHGLRVSGHYPDRGVPVDEMLGMGMSTFEHADEFASIAFAEDASEEHIRAIARRLKAEGIGITTILTPAQKYLEIDAKGKDYYSGDTLADILDRLGPFYLQEANCTIDNVIQAGGRYTQQWKDGTVLALRAAAIFMEEDVTLAIGTEGVGSFYSGDGVGVQDEMALLKDAGLTNAQVFKIATANGAELLGLADHKGAIRRGYDADLLILAANPLDDLAAFQSPEGVLVMGRYYASQALEALRQVY